MSAPLAAFLTISVRDADGSGHPIALRGNKIVAQERSRSRTPPANGKLRIRALQIAQPVHFTSLGKPGCKRTFRPKTSHIEVVHYA